MLIEDDRAADEREPGLVRPESGADAPPIDASTGRADRDDGKGSAPRRWLRVLWTSTESAAPFVLGWLLTVVTFYPGHVSGDTADAWYAATGEWDYTTWHPPMHAVVWAALNVIWHSPGSMLLFQTAVFWLSLWLLAEVLWRRLGVRTHVYWVAASLLPFVMNYQGALIKDTFSTVLMLAAVVALVFERLQPRFRWPLLAGAWSLLLIGAAAKLPSLPIAVPLAAYAAWRASGRTSGRLRRAVHVGGATVGFVAVFGILTMLVASAVSARQAHIENSVYLYDLQGMSAQEGHSLVDDDIVPDEREAEFVTECRDRREWDKLAWGNCSWVVARVNELGRWNGSSLRSEWLDAMLDHPDSYLVQRLQHVWSYQTSVGKDPFYYERVDDRLTWVPTKTISADAYSRVVDAVDWTPFFRPIFWTMSSVALAAWAGHRLRSREAGHFAPLVLAMSTGGLAFYAGLAVIGVAYEFRYSYNVIVLTMVATGLIFAERRARLRADE